MDVVNCDRVNPTSLLLASSRMLRHVGLPSHAQRIDTALERVFADQKVHTIVISSCGCPVCLLVGEFVVCTCALLS